MRTIRRPVLALLWAGAVAAQAQDAAIPSVRETAFPAGRDAAGADAARGLPWIAHSAVDAFYLQAPEGAGGGRPYQISAYQGFTIQSLAFASFHAGWRYRETQAPGLSGPYREIFALKVLGTAEILRDHLFVSVGGSVPLVDGSVAEADTAALHRSLSGYSPLPSPNFVTPQGLQTGVFGRVRAGAWDLMAGATYARPTRFEPVDGYPFHPASQIGGTFRAVLETEASRHRFEAKVSRYGEERTATEDPAHREGTLYQGRYAWLRASGRTAWQMGLGAAAKTPDANRQRYLRAALEPSEANDNVQRAYAEAAWTWSPAPSRLWRAWVIPKLLLEASTREAGHETELGAALGLRLREAYRLKVGGTLLAGSFQGTGYLGAGLRAELAFRHLGLQDLDTAPGAGGAPTAPGGEGN
jgi:hypothetical protein